MRCRTSALTVATAPSLLLNGRDLLSSAGHELNACKYVCTVVDGFVVGWLGLVTVIFGFDLQGWITVLAAGLLALITLLASYDHVDFLGAASVDLPQQAGIPCIAAALATAIDQQVGIQPSI